jgi:hypothetical protein
MFSELNPNSNPSSKLDQSIDDAQEALQQQISEERQRGKDTRLTQVLALHAAESVVLYLELLLAAIRKQVRKIKGGSLPKSAHVQRFLPHAVPMRVRFFLCREEEDDYRTQASVGTSKKEQKEISKNLGPLSWKALASA